MAPETFREKWGYGRFATLDSATRNRISLPDEDREFLDQVGLPVETGIYDITFDFPSDRLLTLREVYPKKRNVPVQYADHLVLGHNDSMFLCAVPITGIVVSIDKYGEGECVFVNSSVAKMAETVVLMRNGIAEGLAHPDENRELLHWLQEEVIRIDPHRVPYDERLWAGMIFELSSFI